MTTLVVFRWGRAGNYLHRLNRIEGDLVRKNFTVLVRIGLTVDVDRVFRVVAEPVIEPIGIGRDTGS